ncbi:MAG: serine/threonine-protein kinase, partial [Myxococcota bacterium]
MPSSSTSTPSTPRRVPVLGDRYAVVRRIGKGGAAGVYLVFDQSLQQWRAAKVLHRRHVEQDELRMRFLREARTMARLDHTNVVRVLDVVDQIQPFMIMEYIEGGCVLDWLRIHGPMPPFMAVKVLIDVCKALGATHASRIVHRDVKPHNILVTLKGVCKLTDYGIAKIAPEDAGLAVDYDRTAEGASMGTDAFMSPEQRQDASKVDERADVYSVGATLYTLCTRKAAVDLCMWAEDHPKLEPVPDVLRAILLKACHRVPAERYANVGELEEALSAVLWSLPSVPATAPTLVMPLPEVPARPPETIDSDTARELSDLWLDEVDTNHNVAIDEATFGSMNGQSSLAGSQPSEELSEPEDLSPATESDNGFAPIAGLIAGAVVIGCLALGTAVAAGAGAQQVSVAAHQYRDAEADYIESLTADLGLVEKLVTAGAQRERLENAWGALQAGLDSPGRVSLAVQYTSALKWGWDQVPSGEGPSLDVIRERHQVWRSKCNDWNAVAQTETGSVAVALGWASAPGEELVGA